MEKLVSSKLMKKDANKRIATVDRHVGVVRRILQFITAIEQSG
jgi:hypothetical protein